MKIAIKDGIPVGTLKLNGKCFRGGRALTVIEYLDNILYNFKLSTWSELDSGIIWIKMQGSIISMMQFKKYLDFNFPTAIIK